MSDLSITSCRKDTKCDSGSNSIFLIFILLFLCGGDNGLFGLFNGSSSCGCNNGLDGILPILLLLCFCGGSLF